MKVDLVTSTTTKADKEALQAAKEQESEFKALQAKGKATITVEKITRGIVIKRHNTTL